MIPESKIKELRKALTESARPLIFFDDDADGLSSFLQFYKLNPEAKGVIFKAAGGLDKRFINIVETHDPDRIFILDIPEVKQEFVDKAKREIYWLDHHSPIKLKNVKYYNPMLKGEDNRPTSYWANKITQSSLWLTMTGCVGDWFLPKDLKKEFIKEYPELLDKKIKQPQDALFDSKIGQLAKVFSFVLKGSTKSAMTCVKILTRIKEPEEILEQSTSKGKYLWKKFLKINQNYLDIKNSVKITKEKIVLYIYDEHYMSLTADLSNELLFENPDKFIIVGRIKSGEYKLSLRSAKYEVLPILEKALKDVEGYGGGHLYACGANIKEHDWDKFLENIKKQL